MIEDVETIKMAVNNFLDPMHSFPTACTAPRGRLDEKSENFRHLGAAFTDWRVILYGQADPYASSSSQISHEFQISHESVQRVAPAWRKF